MKNYTILSIAGLALVAALFLTAFKPNDKSASNASNYILVEIYEIPTYKDKGVHIHYGNGKRELIPFKEFIAENHDDNGDIILNAINKLVADGYSIESTCSGLAEGGMITKVFLKK